MTVLPGPQAAAEAYLHQVFGVGLRVRGRCGEAHPFPGGERPEEGETVFVAMTWVPIENEREARLCCCEV